MSNDALLNGTTLLLEISKKLIDFNCTGIYYSMESKRAIQQIYEQTLKIVNQEK